MSPAQIISIHKKYAPSDAVYELVYTHCCIVRDIAMQLIEAKKLDLDKELVMTGAMLHDIGVYPLFNEDSLLKTDAHYIQHGIEGEHILKDEGFEESLWRFASHHTGVGISSDEIIREKLPLPAADYYAETDEELLVMYADKFHSKTTPPYFNSYEWYREDIKRFGQHKSDMFDSLAIKFGKPDLYLLQQKYGYEIR
jgi:uncharacterized protein